MRVTAELFRLAVLALIALAVARQVYVGELLARFSRAGADEPPAITLGYRCGEVLLFVVFVAVPARLAGFLARLALTCACTHHKNRAPLERLFRGGRLVAWLTYRLADDVGQLAGQAADSVRSPAKADVEAGGAVIADQPRPAERRRVTGRQTAALRRCGEVRSGAHADGFAGMAVVLMAATILCAYSYVVYDSSSARDRLRSTLLFFLGGLAVGDVLFGVVVAVLCCQHSTRYRGAVCALGSETGGVRFGRWGEERCVADAARTLGRPLGDREARAALDAAFAPVVDPCPYGSWNRLVARFCCAVSALKRTRPEDARDAPYVARGHRAPEDSRRRGPTPACPTLAQPGADGPPLSAHVRMPRALAPRKTTPQRHGSPERAPSTVDLA